MNDSLPCPAEWHSEEPSEYREPLSDCQHIETTFFDFSTRFTPSCNSLRTYADTSLRPRLFLVRALQVQRRLIANLVARIGFPRALSQSGLSTRRGTVRPKLRLSSDHLHESSAVIRMRAIALGEIFHDCFSGSGQPPNPKPRKKLPAHTKHHNGNPGVRTRTAKVCRILSIPEFNHS
jgi:hypothetical protein